MTENELQAILARNPQVTTDDPHTSNRKLPSTHPKPRETYVLVDVAKGKETSVARPFIKFTFFFSGRCDPDAYRGGEKDLLDGLVKAGIIAGDEADKITLAPPEQIRVDYKKDQRTEIEISLP